MSPYVILKSGMQTNIKHMKKNSKSQILKSFFCLTLPLLKLGKMLRSLIGHQRQINIITFHDIPVHKINEFKSFITDLAKSFDFISPKEFEEAFLRAKPLPKNPMLITFDDGMKSSFEIWKQVLAPLKIKAAFFVCPEYLLKHNSKRDDVVNFIKENLHLNQITEGQIHDGQNPMSLEDAKMLIENENIIGSHSFTHKTLSLIQNEDELKYEIKDSKSKLEALLDCPVNWFAYPFGAIEHINRKALNLISKTYTFCFSNIRGSNNTTTNPYCLRRQNIDINSDLKKQLYIVYGGLNFFYKQKTKLLDSMISDKSY